VGANQGRAKKCRREQFVLMLFVDKNQKDSMDKIWWLLPLIPFDRTFKMLSENAFENYDHPGG